MDRVLRELAGMPMRRIDFANGPPCPFCTPSSLTRLALSSSAAMMACAVIGTPTRGFHKATWSLMRTKPPLELQKCSRGSSSQ